MLPFCNVSGFFSLTSAQGDEGTEHFRTPGNQRNTNTVGLSFSYYNTQLSCSDGSNITARVRVPCQSHHPLHCEESTAFVVGSAYIQSTYDITYIDAKHVKFIANGDDSTVAPIPNFFITHIDSLACVCGEAYVLNDGTVVFPVLISVHILNEIKHFRLMYDSNF